MAETTVFLMAALWVDLKAASRAYHWVGLMAVGWVAQWAASKGPTRAGQRGVMKAA